MYSVFGLRDQDYCIIEGIQFIVVITMEYMLKRVKKDAVRAGI